MVEVIKNNADFKFDWSKQNPRLFGTLRVRHDGMAGTFEKVEVPNGNRVFWPDCTPLVVQVLSLGNLENKKRYTFTFTIQEDLHNQIGFEVVAEPDSIKESVVHSQNETFERAKNEIAANPNSVRIAKQVKDYITQTTTGQSNLGSRTPEPTSDSHNSSANAISVQQGSPKSTSGDRTNRPQILLEEVSDEVLQEIGKRGEVYLFPILCEQFTRVEWMNQNGESLLPYDFQVEDADGKILFIDCKATDFDSPTFFLSLSEWEFVLANSNRYAIYRIFNLKASPQVIVINDPLKHIIDGDIYPCSFEKRILNAGTIPLCLGEHFGT